MAADREMADAIRDARLLLACAEAMRQVLRDADSLELSLTEERAVILKGTRFLVENGAYLSGGKIYLPAQAPLN